MATINELEEQLAKAKQLERLAENASRKAQDAAWSLIEAIPENWEWSCKLTEYREFASKASTPAVAAVYVQKRIRPELVVEWAKNGHATFSACWHEAGRWYGMVYFRTDEGILTHGGGGTLILNDPKLCSDDEWAAIVAGKVPTKFIK